MMTEVGGKLKAGLLLTSVAVFGVMAFSAQTADMVKIKGEACENFVPGQSKSSIRVRVTDKASYKAVSQVEKLAEIRSDMLEHDFNVIVYNLVDNYVRDLMVRTTSQSDQELCVKVTGAIPAADIESVIANYSPNTPAPEYDIKEAAGIEEEVLAEAPQPKTPLEPDAEVLYNGPEEEKAGETAETEEIKEEAPEPAVSGEEPAAAVVYNGADSDEAVPEIVYEDDALPEDGPDEEETDSEEILAELPADSEDIIAEAMAGLSSEQDQQPSAAPAERKAYVYVGPVEFNNNTHSTKPSQVLKDMFADTPGYQLVDNPGAAAYALFPKVLKAKVDSLNSQTKRIQMVVSLQLQVRDSSVSFSEHQNRFVLFESGENEQEIAQKLLHKLLRKAGRTLFSRIEQAEEKRKRE